MANHSGNIKFPNLNLIWQRVAFKKQFLKKALLAYPLLNCSSNGYYDSLKILDKTKSLVLATKNVTKIRNDAIFSLMTIFHQHKV